ncbi:unnamed protein product [Penicillium glandicola]
MFRVDVLMSRSKAPLITLFGERLTKQFLSESISTLDNVIFALSPLGVLTAIVSVIRICGSSSLKAFVGRAQEGPAEAEIELLPCVSESTAELFNDGGITRVFGRPKLLEIVFWEDVDFETGKKATKIGTMQDALRQMVWSCNNDFGCKLPAETIPNLLLNAGIKRRGQFWFHCAAILGVLLQAGTIVFAALTVFMYPQNFQKDGKAVASYAFPLYFIGSILLFIGMFFCAFILDGSSKEHYFKAERPSKIYWLQPGNQNVGDQAFSTFLAVKEGPESSMTEDLIYIRSIRDRRFDQKYLEIYFTLASTLIGFILQFIGLRGLHASVTLAQLGSTFLMAIIRTWLRTERMTPDDNKMDDDRGMASLKQQELDCFAFHLDKVESFNLIPQSNQPANMSSPNYMPLIEKTLGMQLIQRRIQLASMISMSRESSNVAWWDEMPIRELAHNLAQMIESTMDVISSWGVDTNQAWAFGLDVECKGASPGSGAQSQGESFVRLMETTHPNARCKVSFSELEAVLGLWVWSLCKSDNHLATSPRLFRLVGLDIKEAGEEDTYLYFRKWIFRQKDTQLVSHDLLRGSQRLFGSDPGWYSNRTLLAVETRSSVETMAAQDIFIQFLKRIFFGVKELGGQVDVARGSSRDHDLVASSTRIDELASCFEAHCFGSREDALLCIVPVLKNQGLLPEIAADSSVIRARREEYIKQGNWKDAFHLLFLFCQRPAHYSPELSSYELGFLCRRALLSNDENVCIQGFEQICILLRLDPRAWPPINTEPPDETLSQSRIQWSGFCGQLGWIAWNISTKVPGTKFIQPTLKSLNVLETLRGWNDADYSAEDIKKGTNAIEGWLTSHTLDLEPNASRDDDEIAFDWLIRNNYYTLLYFLLLRWIELSEHCPALIMRAYSFVGKNRSLSALLTLIRYNADIEAIDSNGRTALTDRIMSRDLDGAKMLLQYGAKPQGGDEPHSLSPLFLALRMGDHDIAALLLQYGATIHDLDKKGFSVMWWACNSGKLDIVDLVLHYKAAIDPVGPDGLTPLLYCARNGKLEMLNFLIDKGANFNAGDVDGQTALMSAVKENSLRILTLLLEKGADIDVEDNEGRTALDLATEKAHLDIISTLECWSSKKARRETT